MAKPKSTEMKTTCSVSPRANAPTMVSGTICITKSVAETLPAGGHLGDGASVQGGPIDLDSRSRVVQVRDDQADQECDRRRPLRSR